MTFRDINQLYPTPDRGGIEMLARRVAELLIVTGNPGMGCAVSEVGRSDWNPPVAKFVVCPFEGPDVLDTIRRTGGSEECELQMECLSAALRMAVQDHLSMGHQSYVVFLETQLGELGVDKFIEVKDLVRNLDYPAIAQVTGETFEDMRSRINVITGLGSHEAIYAEIRQWLVSFQQTVSVRV